MNARWILPAAMVLWLSGLLAADDQPAVPVTVAEYDAARAKPDSRTVAPQVVRLYNLRRVLDSSLPAADRVASLQLVQKIGGDDKALAEAMGALAADPKTPPELQQLATRQIVQKDEPVVSGKAITMLASAPPGSPLRQAVLDKLLATADPSILADLIKVWAQEPPNGPDEDRFRRVAEKAAGQSWDQALLTAINTEPFFARGSAMSVLAARQSLADAAPKIAAMKPRTEAMYALQASVSQLGYLPDGGPALLALVSVYRAGSNSFADVAKLVRQWKTEGDYTFNVRDFHLLSRLSADPLRKPMKRDTLVSALSAKIPPRQHVARAGAADGADSFAKQEPSLSMADLWNLYLLDQMLTRPRVLLALRVMAAQDRADTRTAWGGLVVYESGGAEARLYPPEKDAPPDDLRYVPSKQMIAEGRDSMCRFVAHFEKANNASRAGPTAEELAAAREGNYYGLVLTTVSEEEFTAHYFTPRGTVISLGRIPFKF